MKKNMQYFLVLLILLFLSISVVNASDNTTTDITDHTLEKTTPQIEKVVTSTQEEIQKDNKNDINSTLNEKKINKISTKEKKEAKTVDVYDYNSLKNAFNSFYGSNLTINIQADITLGGNAYISSKGNILTINGNNYTINGNQKHQFLYIDHETTVNIDNITITNCKGGAIRNDGILTITNSIFTNNYETSYGGAITNNGKINKIENTVFNNNTPANFVIEDNVIKLKSRDNFISVGDFTIIVDGRKFHGTGSFDAYTIPSDSKNVKLILNGTDSKTVNNIFILKETPLVPEEITLNEGNWAEYFNDDGTVKGIVVPGSEIRFEGEFSDKFMIINIPLNLTSAPTQGVLKNSGITVTADNVNITKLVMTSEDTGEALITVEDASNVNIEDNTLTMTTTKDLVETRAIIVDGGSDNIIRNNTITTVGPEDPIEYSADSSINKLYTTSIEANSDRLVIDSNRITTKKNDAEAKNLGTIFGIYIHGTNDKLLDSPQIINNEFVTEGKVYDYGVKLHYANDALIENNTVDTNSELYSSGIHVFVLNNSIINNNTVNTIATNMSYAIVLEGAMDLITYDVHSTENTQITKNTVNAGAKYVWAVEAYAGENNEIAYNNITVNADNGVAIALADKKSYAHYNNIDVQATMKSGISGSFDYIDPYTTGIKISNNGLKAATDNNVMFNNVTVTTQNNEVYAVNTTTKSNLILDNYLLTNNYAGDNAVITTDTSNLVIGNIPLPEIITLNDANWTEYFNDDGTVKNTVIPGSELRFEGIFNNRTMIITKALNLTTAQQQAILNNCTITVEYDNVNITNIQMNANDVEGSLIYVEEASNIRIENNILTLNNSGKKIVTHTIDAYASPNMIIRNNTITTVGPEENIVYDSSNQISLVYTNSINIESSNGTIIDNNIITTQTNGKNASFGTIYGVYVTGKYAYEDEKYVNDIQIINNTVYTKSDIYAYGIDLGHMDGAIVCNNDVTTIGKNYADGIQGFNVYNVDFTNNSVSIAAESMGYGIIVNGFMHFSIDYETYDYEIEVLSVKDNTVSGNNIDLSAEDAWAIEIVIAEDNTVEYNNITLSVSNGIGIGFADSENGLAQNNNISILATQIYDSNYGDALNSYTTGIKICQSLSQVKAATDNKAVFNNITVTAPNKDVHAVNVSSSDNEITDNYLITKNYAGDNAVKDTGKRNTVENNTPVPEIITLNDGNWTEYFNDDGTVKNTVVPCSELRFEGNFNNRFMIIDIPLNLTTAQTQGILKDSSITVTADNVNITKLVINTEDVSEALINVEDAYNVNIEDNTLTMTTTKDLVETRAIIIDGGSDNIIRNNTITTIGPEDPIEYGADSSINTLYTTSIEAKSDKLIVDSNRITTKKNDLESENLGTIFGIYIHGTNDKLLDSPQIINNEFVTEGKVYDYGIKLHYANNALIENNTVDTNSELYSSGIHVFVLNNSIINNNIVNSNATNMSYAIVLEGAMDLITYDVHSTENTFVTNNIVNASAKYVWAVESYAGENNEIAYNNITVNADNGVAIALADQNSTASYNNIDVQATMNSSISGSFDYIDPYTTGIKVSNNGLKAANDNTVEFNNVTVTAPNNEVCAVNATTNRNTITDNHLLTANKYGDNAVIATGINTTVENNNPNLTITDETYSDYFDEFNTLKVMFNNTALIVSSDFKNHTVFIFDNVNVTLTNDGTAVFYDGQIMTGNNATVIFDGLVFNNTMDAFVLESEGNTIKNTVINIDSDDEIHAIYVYDDNNIISNTTLNIIAPSANVEYNPDYSVKTPAPAAIIINSNNNIIEDTTIYFDGREAIHSEDPYAWDAPTVNGIYIVSSDTPIENNIITNTSIEVIGSNYAYGINVGNAKNTTIKEIDVEVMSEYYADAIQLFDADTITITGEAKTMALSEGYGVYSTAMGTGFSKNIDLTGLDIDVNAPKATGILLEGSSNIIMADAIYRVNGDETIAITAAQDWMNNTPTNITINNLDIYVYGREENSILYFTKADTINITDNNIISTKGSEIFFNQTPNSQVVNNYIKINDVIFGNIAVISTENDTIIANNTPTSQKIEEMQQTIDELQKEIDQLKTAKETTLTIDEITDAKYKANVTISGTLVNKDNIGLYNQIITLTIGNTPVNITTKNGIFEYITSFKELGEKTVTATYAGNEKYQASEANTTFNVEKQDIIITYDPIKDVKYKDNITITGKITDINGNGLYNINALITINGKLYKAKTDKTGAFTLTTIAKTVGNNKVTLSYGGNTYYNSYETTTTFNVEKQDIILTYNTIQDAKYKDTITITGKITDINGNGLYNINALITINGKLYKAKTDKTGAFTLTTIAKTVGNNKVTLSYGGNTYYNSYETTTTFNVEQQNITIQCNPIADTTIGDDVTITGVVSDANGYSVNNINVNIRINGKLYKAKTDKTGAFTLTTTATTTGTNNVTLSYNGNANYYSAETITTFKVIAKAE